MSVPIEKNLLAMEEQIADDILSKAATADPLADSERVLLELLFKKYRSSLFRHLTCLVPSRDDAAELVQESYARLLRHSGIARFESVARAYLFRTATNLARDHFRRRVSRHADAHVDIDDLPVAAEGLTPERTIAWDQTIASIKQGLQRLPIATRRVFVLSRFRGKTYPEIAVILGVSSRTVERKMSEAMAELAARIGETL